MNPVTTWFLKRIAKRAAWNYHGDRALHQRRALLTWYRIMHDAITDEVIDHTDVLREMSQDAHDKVWGNNSNLNPINPNTPTCVPTVVPAKRCPLLKLKKPTCTTIVRQRISCFAMQSKIRETPKHAAIRLWQMKSKCESKS